MELLALLFTLGTVLVSLAFTVLLTLASLAIPAFIVYKMMQANQERARLLAEGQCAVGQIVSA